MACEMFVNGNRQAVASHITDLEGLLAAARNDLTARELIPVAVRVDGGRFSEVYPHQAREVRLSEVTRVDIDAQTPEAFALAFLHSANDYLSVIEAGFAAAVEQLHRAACPEDGFDLLARSLAGLSAFKQHLDGVLPMLGVDADGVVPQADWQRLETVADKVMNSQRTEGQAAIADCLRTEILPMLADWKTHLPIPAGTGQSE